MSQKNQNRGAKAPLLHSEITVTIDRLAMGGSGIARHEGMVVFVPQSAPGDTLLIRITTAKKNFAEGEILKILNSGSSRREAPCPVASKCGGCNWQHITEDEQRKQKEQIVLSTIEKFNRGLTFEYLGIEPSPKSFRYRNRIQPKYEKGSFGFFARNSHSIVEVEDCLITEEPLTQEFEPIRTALRKNKNQSLQKLEIYLDTENRVHHSTIQSQEEGVGFSQVNRFQNQSLLQTTLDWCDRDLNKVIELYAGSGNFTFALASRFSEARITAVELNPKLVQRGRSLIKNQSITFLESDVESALGQISIKNSDLILIDPPRAGTSEQIMTLLAQSGAKKIIYISCHPVSLARDLQWFFAAAEKNGHKARLTRLKCFEMFPQTDHVETIAELRVDT